MNPAPMHRDGVKCALCGYVFNKENSRTFCKGCPMARGCNFIRCPNCGYENPEEPEWFKKIKKRRTKNGIDGQG